MIEIGKKYTLTMLELGPDGYDKGAISVTVTGRDGNLVEVNGCEVINLASPLFYSLIDEAGQMAYYQTLQDNVEKSISSS
ncbi:hypothetical protein [Pontivivens nitratireducens]|uniref:hypothetical protein n=1 Tax=Pontivivens nitratireducens TaxID=2758038 RepID=UPI00163A549F|nr:hypothetical protein [Pontibrevibacter nitratireducens]